ncbi:MAG: hypothetical protein EOP53_08335 [Sphingobacteriales bacterium]|nr:MAG: hypothetical protein EOP53_08335 [Sphingobacteriales bacterium]
MFNPTSSELSAIKNNGVKNIYLRFFDVAWDATYLKPSPIAQVRIADTAFIKSNQLQIIPTVFITNECIRYIRPDQCKALAENIYKLISNIVAANNLISVKEIQIDCDWTASTKEKYFTLLSELQKIDTVHLYSATIRLFQVKYVADAGVPPVKKGLLMCYNMGNLKSIETNNSILDPAEVKKYTSNLDKYPLPLDVALPLFDWYILYRNNGYTGIIQNLQKDSLNRYAIKIGANRYQINNDVQLSNVSFKKADVLRYEGSSYEDIMATASIIKQKIKGDSLRLVLYHLDSITLSKYSDHEIEAIFRSLR